MASTATSPCVSHQSEGISKILVNRQNRRGSVVTGMIWIWGWSEGLNLQSPRVCRVPRLSTTNSGISGRRCPELLGNPHEWISPLVERGLTNVR